MKILMMISMMSLLSCGLNSRLFDNPLAKSSSAAAGAGDGTGNAGNGPAVLDATDDLVTGSMAGGANPSINVSANDTGSNCAPITYTAGACTNCTFTGTLPTVTITPTTIGAWDFAYTATCSDGTSSDTAFVSGTAVMLQAVSANDDVVAASTSGAANPALDVSSNDTETNCAPITYTAGTCTNCTFVGALPAVTITPTAVGAWDFAYTATCFDGSRSDTGLVSGTAIAPPINANVDAQTDLVTNNRTSVWNTDLGLTDDDGNPVSDGKVRITLRNCDAGQTYFDGDFLVGSFLNSDNPTNTYGGLLDWNSDVQPFFDIPSELKNGTSYGFNKKAWAQHVQANYPQLNIYNHFHKNSTGEAVNLCVDYRLDNGAGYSDPSTTVFLKSYHYSLDNDALVDDESRVINGRLTIGGPVFIDPSFTPTSYDRALCSFERLRNDVRAQLTHVASYFQAGAWVSSAATGGSYWRTIASFLNTTAYSEHVTLDMPQPDPNHGQSCVNYQELFYIYAAVTDGSLQKVRLSNGVDNSKFVEVELGIYESF